MPARACPCQVADGDPGKLERERRRRPRAAFRRSTKRPDDLAADGPGAEDADAQRRGRRGAWLTVTAGGMPPNGSRARVGLDDTP